MTVGSSAESHIDGSLSPSTAVHSAKQRLADKLSHVGKHLNLVEDIVPVEVPSSEISDKSTKPGDANMMVWLIMLSMRYSKFKPCY